MLHVGRSIETCVDMPVVIDLCRGLKTEQEMVVIVTRYFFGFNPKALARIGILELAVPLHHVGIALQVRNAYAEVVELICELRGKAIDQRTVARTYAALCHCLCDHLRHLIARDVAVTAIGAVAIAFNDAVRSELGHSVICPMVTGHIRERIGSCKRRRSCTDDKRRCQRGYECLLHEKLLLR